MKKEQNSKEKKAKKQIKKTRQELLTAKGTKNKPPKHGKTQSVKKTKAKKANTVIKSAQAPESGVLLRSYGETRLALIPLEPCLVHVYWEIAPSEFENSKHLSGEDLTLLQPVLRFYDVTNISDYTNDASYSDVDVELQAKNCYVRLLKPGRSYFVELGFKSSKGRFFPLVRSNFAQIPPAMTAEVNEVSYMLVKGVYKVVEILPPLIKRELFYGCAVPSVSYPGIGPALVPVIPFINDIRFMNRSVLDLTEMSEMAFTSGVSSELFQTIMEKEKPFAG
jgi:hypothetical protein